MWRLIVSVGVGARLRTKWVFILLSGLRTDQPGRPRCIYVGDERRRKRGKRKGRRRRGVFEGLAMEANWKRARKMLKWGMLADLVWLVLWGSEVVFVLLGKRCPCGDFDGW